MNNEKKEQRFENFKFWNELSKSNQSELIAFAFIFFPEILGVSPKKYHRYAAWLASHHGILCTNIRDLFGAGGVTTIVCDGIEIESAPRVFAVLNNHSSRIQRILDQVTDSNLAFYYRVKPDSIRRIGRHASWVGNAQLAAMECMGNHKSKNRIRPFLMAIAGK